MRTNTAGFTLPEFVLASAILTITAVAIAGVFGTLSNAYSMSERYYDSLQTGQMAIKKVQAAVRGAQLVTAANDYALVVWAEDANRDEQINLSELSVFLWTPDGDLIQARVEFPDAMAEGTRNALDTPLALWQVTDVDNALGLIGASPHLRQVTLATGVQDCSFSVTPTPPATALVTVEMTLGAETELLTIRSASSPRVKTVERVAVSGGQYVLTPGQ